MSTSRNIYLTISLPGQNIEETLNEQKLMEHTISKKNLLKEVGDKKYIIDDSDKAVSKYSSGAAKLVRQLFESTVKYYVAEGLPFISVGSGLGRDDLRYFKKIDPGFGYDIYVVDFIAPELEKASDVELIDKLEPLVKDTYSRKKLEGYLNRYHSVKWDELGWKILTPTVFFSILSFPFVADPYYHDPIPEELVIIGDVHGDYDDLVEILDSHPKADFTLLGDYIDRGPQSGKVIRLLLERHESLHLLSGNHEVNLRKKYIEKRTTIGRLQQDTVNQLSEEGIGENEIRTFLSLLGTYRAIHFANRNIVLSHAGMEPSLTLNLALHGGIDLVPSEIFLYGIKKEGESSYDRDVDFEWVSHPIKHAVMIHGHRNKFERVGITEEHNKTTTINLADQDTTTLRYATIQRDKSCEVHIRKRFSNDERIISFDL
ncbi:metallophosphoesterase [Companilactobacillus ginsenosidimutans]|uniref:Calcineurin-like phosphoesterase domain-containing protein n=1 Tax=Companilactobacillus ginsenosidimutans TaxID=1007676 RepID=A0A0H4QK88_9LACO|nr:metallophosphoesterase [Companilactobacillus ginsenosidimutans]AKP67461.1 hypothetical protein ABM34_07915 [Companilactobacillus ginsenosidimutans]